MTWFMGIDPGKLGGFGLVSDDSEPVAFKMPETASDLFDLFDLFTHDFKPKAACVEKVHAMPGQGVTSVFTFGYGYGLLVMALTAARIPYTEVPPGTWQRKLGCLSHGNKNVTKNRAQQLFPSLPKISHNVADALLIAEYARRVELGL